MYGRDRAECACIKYLDCVCYPRFYILVQKEVISHKLGGFCEGTYFGVLLCNCLLCNGLWGGTKSQNFSVDHSDHRQQSDGHAK